MNKCPLCPLSTKLKKQFKLLQNFAEIRKCMFITSVTTGDKSFDTGNCTLPRIFSDTGENFITGYNNIEDKFIAGDNDIA